MWIANPKTKHAYKIVRRVKRRAVTKVINAYGLVFEVSDDKIERCGYHVVKAKPNYAEQGDYKPR